VISLFYWCDSSPTLFKRKGLQEAYLLKLGGSLLAPLVLQGLSNAMQYFWERTPSAVRSCSHIIDGDTIINSLIMLLDTYTKDLNRGEGCNPRLDMCYLKVSRLQ